MSRVTCSFLGNHEKIPINGNPATAGRKILAFFDLFRPQKLNVTVTDTKSVQFRRACHASPEHSVEITPIRFGELEARVQDAATFEQAIRSIVRLGNRWFLEMSFFFLSSPLIWDLYLPEGKQADPRVRPRFGEGSSRGAFRPTGGRPHSVNFTGSHNWGQVLPPLRFIFGGLRQFNRDSTLYSDANHRNSMTNGCFVPVESVVAFKQRIGRLDEKFSLCSLEATSNLGMTGRYLPHPFPA
ncbi:hypothetical protein DFH06DRAFT_1129717 [Mycena polygramma]|nr:hypothetical protein DFH06DRAFT_1129717 [Mycena polygramma]